MTAKESSAVVRLLFASALFAIATACAPSPTTPAMGALQPAPLVLTLASLGPRARAHGFTASAVYVDDDQRRRGARFVHERTGFVFDYLQIETAPQAYVHVRTYADSDNGAPHTQEHLLLGRGDKGRFLGNFEHANLGRSRAYTTWFRTAYQFGTTAGIDAFWGLFRTNLDALLHPDYSDEEIRREVHDFEVRKGANGALDLEEKGTVYNEMVWDSESPFSIVWYETARLLYGPGHPLSVVHIGSPAGIRTLTPEVIRRFHAAHYQLGNMTMIGAFPAAVALDTVLARTAETLDGFAAAGEKRTFMTEVDVPPAHGAPPGTLKVAEFPYATADRPSRAIFAWPASRNLPPEELLVLQAFLEAFAGGASSTLYGAFIDRETRALDMGTTDVWAGVQEVPGQPAMIGFEGIATSHADVETMRRARDVILARVRAIAALPDGSKELADFNQRFRARIVQRRRAVDKLLDTPPRFGVGADTTWADHLARLEQSGGFERSATLTPAATRALAIAASTHNEWHDRVAAWGLLDDPYGVATRPSPALRERLTAERAARARAEVDRLTTAYGLSDPQEALRRRQDEIAQIDAALARAEAAAPMSPLVANPPLTQDEGLRWRVESHGQVPVVASTFDLMKSATVGLALRLDGVPDSDLVYVALLPTLLRKVGVVHEGIPVPYDVMSDRLRTEILGLGASFRTSLPRERAELVISGSGNDVEETRRAIGWMRDLLTSPDWRKANVSRLRDVVREGLQDLRATTSRPESSWIPELAQAYWRQDHPVLMHSASFPTRAFDAHRLSWMLEAGDASRSFAAFLERLAGAKGDRAALASLATALAEPAKPPATALPRALAPYLDAARALPPAARALAAKAGRDLAQLLADIPDESLASDWRALCKQMARDVQQPLDETLAGLKRALSAIRRAPAARAWVVGSTRHQEAIRGDLDRLLAVLEPAAAPPVSHDHAARVFDRARSRAVAGGDPSFVALVNPSAANGALANDAPLAAVEATDENALVDYLAANVLNGMGAHGLFKAAMRSGLSYSGYSWASDYRSRMGVYVDRCADLAQMLRFIDDLVRKVPADARFVDYALPLAFWSRAADTYEDRASGVAMDLADGMAPDKTRAFRERLLALRGREGLAARLHARIVPLLASVVPSLSNSPLPRDAVSFVVAPERQIAAYEGELRRTRGDGTRVTRLWPRDFWDLTDEAKR